MQLSRGGGGALLPVSGPGQSPMEEEDSAGRAGRWFWGQAVGATHHPVPAAELEAESWQPAFGRAGFLPNSSGKHADSSKKKKPKPVCFFFFRFAFAVLTEFMCFFN